MTGPREALMRGHRRAAASAQPAWITLLESERLLAALAAADPRQPLYGWPVAIKDNIDLAGSATTAGCPAFAYTPQRSAGVVERLIAAGAIPVGKTNMDQFATGLVGTRTPYGACHSTADPRYVSGGSSSGSAVAVAEGHVRVALGTDTAGSGRVPAACNEIVGLRPSLGRVSARGVVPACRTVDTVSIFARDVADVAAVFAVAAGYDEDDPFSRAVAPLPLAGERPAVAVPAALDFAGDREAQGAFERARDEVADRGWRVEEVDLDPFLRAGSLLYDGPWLAERVAAVGAFLAAHPGDVDPVVADVIAGGRRPCAVDAFRGFYELAELRRTTSTVWTRSDALLLPTTPTIYTHAEIASDPVGRNATLGRFTNFAGLLDLCALALPGPRRADGLPFGISLLAPAGGDERLLSLGARLRGEADAASGRAARPPDDLPLAVVGAHLSGEPLNGELTRRGARLLRCCRTAPHYRLYALAGGPLPRPGLVASDADGPGIEVEVWGCSPTALGEITASLLPPLALGRIDLEDETSVTGFVCEPRGLSGALEITHLGGWRAHVHA